MFSLRSIGIAASLSLSLSLVGCAAETQEPDPETTEDALGSKKNVSFPIESAVHRFHVRDAQLEVRDLSVLVARQAAERCALVHGEMRTVTPRAHVESTGNGESFVEVKYATSCKALRTEVKAHASAYLLEIGFGDARAALREMGADVLPEVSAYLEGVLGPDGAFTWMLPGSGSYPPGLGGTEMVLALLADIAPSLTDEVNSLLGRLRTAALLVKTNHDKGLGNRLLDQIDTAQEKIEAKKR